MSVMVSKACQVMPLYMKSTTMNRKCFSLMGNLRKALDMSSLNIVKIVRWDNKTRMMLKNRSRVSFSMVSWVAVAGFVPDSVRWSICLKAYICWPCFSLICSTMNRRDTTQSLRSSGEVTGVGGVIDQYPTSSANASHIS